MSRGIGSLQRRILAALAAVDDPEYPCEVSVFGLKIYLYGRYTKEIHHGGYIVAEIKEAGRMCCGRGESANLQRALDSLDRRGLIEQTYEEEWKGHPKSRQLYARLTPLGVKTLGLPDSVLEPKPLPDELDDSST